MRNVFEVAGLGTGLGTAGAKMSKSVGAPGINMDSGVKALAPTSAPATAEQPPMTPEEEAALAAEQAPETVEQLPEPQELEYDKLGAPNKNKLTGHIIRRDGKEYVLDWDAEFEVYKLVEPETLRVRTRIRPNSVSTVDFRSGTVVKEAIADIRNGIPVGSLISKLLNG